MQPAQGEIAPPRRARGRPPCLRGIAERARLRRAQPEGEWVGKIDLTQEGDKLVLASQPEAGKCKRECRTVEAACNEVLDRADTEFTEILYKAIQDGNDLEQASRASEREGSVVAGERECGCGALEGARGTSGVRRHAIASSPPQVQRYICNRAAGVCKKKTPPLKGTRKHDERFHALTAEEKQMQDMQANLKETGMSGTMYRREDLAGMMDKMKDFMPEGMGGEEGGEGSVNPAVDEEGDVYDQESGLPIVGESKEEL